MALFISTRDFNLLKDRVSKIESKISIIDASIQNLTSRINWIENVLNAIESKHESMISGLQIKDIDYIGQIISIDPS